MRKGELCGLVKSDVDVRGRTLTVARSYDNDTTRGAHADVLPIAAPLVPYLEDAIRRSPSKWVFPGATAAMRTEEADPQKVLRSALVRAAQRNPPDAALRAQASDEAAAIARGLIEGLGARLSSMQGGRAALSRAHHAAPGPGAPLLPERARKALRDDAVATGRAPAAALP